ncbi:MAG TPA: nucleotidyltransferase [Candidatus Omnitrophica bacterium]|nr:nucleotidyltransferase [Candidatus Omnitrophota bacterium]HBG64808.1 nucleotidyltransferase [Candidatus Omnitrophota bacterium]
MLMKNEIVRTIQAHIEEIKSYGVRRIGIFGSFAKSASRHKSDIDIIIDFSKGKKTFDNYMELKFFLENLFRRKVDLVIKDTLKSRIRKGVLRETAYARL